MLSDKRIANLIQFSETSDFNPEEMVDALEELQVRRKTSQEILDHGPQQAAMIVSALNDAYYADPAAIRAMLALMVPCNRDLYEHPTVECDIDAALVDEHYVVGPFGFLLGAIRAAGIPTICHKWGPPDANGNCKLLGFGLVHICPGPTTPITLYDGKYGEENPNGRAGVEEDSRTEDLEGSGE